MKIGDLITKTKGYGSTSGWIGIVVGLKKPTPRDVVHKSGEKVLVLTHDGIEAWVKKFCEVINEND